MQYGSTCAFLDDLRGFGNRCYLSICVDLGLNNITDMDLLIHFL